MRRPTGGRQLFGPDLHAVLERASGKFGTIVAFKLRKLFIDFEVRTLKDLTKVRHFDIEVRAAFGPKALSALHSIMAEHDLTFRGEVRGRRIKVPVDEVDDIRIHLLTRIATASASGRGTCFTPTEVSVLSSLLESEIAGLFDVS